jgi:hypothetical protein
MDREQQKSELVGLEREAESGELGELRRSVAELTARVRKLIKQRMLNECHLSKRQRRAI